MVIHRVKMTGNRDKATFNMGMGRLVSVVVMMAVVFMMMVVWAAVMVFDEG